MTCKKYTNFVIFLCIILFSYHIFGFTIQSENNLYRYNGTIEHLAFETLMSFPEKSLDEKNNYSKDYDQNKITPIEFKNILEELYHNDYILIDINMLFSIKDGTLLLNEIWIPIGKKPIIFSFDNVTYKSSYQNLGNIDKIIIDRNDNLASYTKKKSIQDRVQYNNEFMLILENFISTHPDFSYQNARGIMFFSGENGVLGYTTNMKNSSSRNECKRVKEVTQRLDGFGWKFGSNNYVYKDNNLISEIEFAKDINLWKKEVGNIVGNSILYAYPFGVSDISQSKKEMLVDAGYKAFFTIDNKNPYTLTAQGLLTMSRRKICGETIRQCEEEFSSLFNCEKVYDHENRKVIFNQLTQ